MSEFEQSAYQSAPEQVESTETPIQQETTEQVEQTPDTTQDESNYFEVKYNKEPYKVSYDEAPTYIQKGLNYDKVSQRASEYEQRLHEIAEITGYQSTDELFQAMALAKQQQEEEKYRQLGIDPQTFNQLLENNPEIQYAREMRAKQEEEQRFKNEANELFETFPDLKPESIQPEVWKVKEQKGLSLLDAYLRVNYKNLGQQKEQEAIQKLQGNAQASPGSLGGGEVNHNHSIKDMSKTDFESLIRRVKNGEVRSL